MSKKRLKEIEPKNKKQREFLNSIVDYPVVFATGSAGTGKTFLAAAKALEDLSYGFVKRIILVRPAVATEDLGYLPGTFEEKLDPYLLPLLDSLATISNPKHIQELLQTKQIEIAPLAFMKGRTFDDTFIILDEAQNSTVEQMKMFLTRFGENVRVVITGDPIQSDIKGTNGLVWAIDKLEACKSVCIIRYNNSHVVRSQLVKDILGYLENDKSEMDTGTPLPPFITDDLVRR